LDEKEYFVDFQEAIIQPLEENKHENLRRKWSEYVKHIPGAQYLLVNYQNWSSKKDNRPQSAPHNQ